MLETARQNSIVSYAGLSKPALLSLAKQAFAQADDEVPERFVFFLPLFPFELIQNMNYLGNVPVPSPKVSPLGFSRDPQEYHAKMYRQFPDLYQGDNYRRNFDYEGRFTGRGVFTVDPAWIARFPQFAPFAGEKLMIYLIGDGPQAVALPESIYPRGGKFLAALEHRLQITGRVEQFVHYLKGRVSGGDVYDPDLIGQEYLDLTGLSPVMLRQSELNRMLQDLSIARAQQNDTTAAGLFTENAKRAENLCQYVPYLYACDTFEPTSVTKHTARLFQPAFKDFDFISNLWIPYQDLVGYVNRETMTVNMQRLCEGYQIAPIYDPLTGGGRYPDMLRGLIVRDRDIPMLMGDVLNNPAYGSGMNPLGMIGKQVFIPESRELIRQRKLAMEPLDFEVENTQLSAEAYQHAMMRSALQEYKGNLVDAMYCREATLSQIPEETHAYETAKASLDRKVAQKQKQVDTAGERWKHCQVSGYDADIDYLRRKQHSREGMPQEDKQPPMPFAVDPQREQSIESGYTMRNNAQRLSYPEAMITPPEAPTLPLKVRCEAPPSPETARNASQSSTRKPTPENETDNTAQASQDSPDSSQAEVPPRTPASFQSLSEKLLYKQIDPTAPKLASIVRRESEARIQVENKDGKMASLKEGTTCNKKVY